MPDGERHPGHLCEIALRNRFHTDVVVERVDLDEVLAAVPARDLVAVHLERQALLVLRRDELYAPQREKGPGHERHDPQ